MLEHNGYYTFLSDRFPEWLIQNDKAQQMKFLLLAQSSSPTLPPETLISDLWLIK